MDRQGSNKRSLRLLVVRCVSLAWLLARTRASFLGQGGWSPTSASLLWPLSCLVYLTGLLLGPLAQAAGIAALLSEIAPSLMPAWAWSTRRQLQRLVLPLSTAGLLLQHLACIHDPDATRAQCKDSWRSHLHTATLVVQEDSMLGVLLQLSMVACLDFACFAICQRAGGFESIQAQLQRIVMAVATYIAVAAVAPICSKALAASLLAMVWPCQREAAAGAVDLTEASEPAYGVSSSMEQAWGQQDRQSAGNTQDGTLVQQDTRMVRAAYATSTHGQTASSLTQVLEGVRTRNENGDQFLRYAGTSPLGQGFDDTEMCRGRSMQSRQASITEAEPQGATSTAAVSSDGYIAARQGLFPFARASVHAAGNTVLQDASGLPASFVRMVDVRPGRYFRIKLALQRLATAGLISAHAAAMLYQQLQQHKGRAGLASVATCSVATAPTSSGPCSTNSSMLCSNGHAQSESSSVLFNISTSSIHGAACLHAALSTPAMPLHAVSHAGNSSAGLHTYSGRAVAPMATWAVLWHGVSVLVGSGLSTVLAMNGLLALLPGLQQPYVDNGSRSLFERFATLINSMVLAMLLCARVFAVLVMPSSPAQRLGASLPASNAVDGLYRTAGQELHSWLVQTLWLCGLQLIGNDDPPIAAALQGAGMTVLLLGTDVAMQQQLLLTHGSLCSASRQSLLCAWRLLPSHMLAAAACATMYVALCRGTGRYEQVWRTYAQLRAGLFGRRVVLVQLTNQEESALQALKSTQHEQGMLQQLQLAGSRLPFTDVSVHSTTSHARFRQEMELSSHVPSRPRALPANAQQSTEIADAYTAAVWHAHHQQQQAQQQQVNEGGQQPDSGQAVTGRYAFVHGQTGVSADTSPANQRGPCEGLGCVALASSDVACPIQAAPVPAPHLASRMQHQHQQQGSGLLSSAPGFDAAFLPGTMQWQSYGDSMPAHAPSGSAASTWQASQPQGQAAAGSGLPPHMHDLRAGFHMGAWTGQQSMHGQILSDDYHDPHLPSNMLAPGVLPPSGYQSGAAMANNTSGSANVQANVLPARLALEGLLDDMEADVISGKLDPADLAQSFGQYSSQQDLAGLLAGLAGSNGPSSVNSPPSASASTSRRLPSRVPSDVRSSGMQLSAHMHTLSNSLQGSSATPHGRYPSRPTSELLNTHTTSRLSQARQQSAGIPLPTNSYGLGNAQSGYAQQQQHQQQLPLHSSSSTGRMHGPSLSAASGLAPEPPVMGAGTGNDAMSTRRPPRRIASDMTHVAGAKLSNGGGPAAPSRADSMGAPLSPGASMAGMAVSMGTEADLVASGFVLLAGEDGSLGSAPFRRQQLMAALAEQQRAQQCVATLKAGVPQAHILASLRTQSWRGSFRPYGRDPGQLAPILSESLQRVATSPQQEALSSQHELNSLCRHVGEGFGGKEGERPGRRISQAQQRRMEAYMQLSSAASDAGQESPHAGAGTLISPKGMLSTASMADAARRQQRMSAAAEELATLPDLQTLLMATGSTWQLPTTPPQTSTQAPTVPRASAAAGINTAAGMQHDAASGRWSMELGAEPSSKSPSVLPRNNALVSANSQLMMLRPESSAGRAAGPSRLSAGAHGDMQTIDGAAMGSTHGMMSAGGALHGTMRAVMHVGMAGGSGHDAREWHMRGSGSQSMGMEPTLAVAPVGGRVFAHIEQPTAAGACTSGSSKNPGPYEFSHATNASFSRGTLAREASPSGPSPAALAAWLDAASTDRQQANAGLLGQANGGPGNKQAVDISLGFLDEVLNAGGSTARPVLGSPSAQGVQHDPRPQSSHTSLTSVPLIAYGSGGGFSPNASVPTPTGNLSSTTVSGTASGSAGGMANLVSNRVSQLVSAALAEGRGSTETLAEQLLGSAGIVPHGSPQFHGNQVIHGRQMGSPGQLAAGMWLHEASQSANTQHTAVMPPAPAAYMWGGVAAAPVSATAGLARMPSDGHMTPTHMLPVQGSKGLISPEAHLQLPPSLQVSTASNRPSPLKRASFKYDTPGMVHAPVPAFGFRTWQGTPADSGRVRRTKSVDAPSMRVRVGLCLGQAQYAYGHPGAAAAGAMAVDAASALATAGVSTYPAVGPASPVRHSEGQLLGSHMQPAASPFSYSPVPFPSQAAGKPMVPGMTGPTHRRSLNAGGPALVTRTASFGRSAGMGHYVPSRFSQDGVALALAGHRAMSAAQAQVSLGVHGPMVGWGVGSATGMAGMVPTTTMAGPGVGSSASSKVLMPEEAATRKRRSPGPEAGHVSGRRRQSIDMPAQPYLHLPTDGDTASGPAPIAHAASAVAAAAAGLRASSFNHPQSSYPHAAPAAEQGRQARHGSTQTLSLDGSAERLNQFADLMNVEAGSAVAMSVGDWDHLAGTGFHRLSTIVSAPPSEGDPSTERNSRTAGALKALARALGGGNGCGTLAANSAVGTNSNSNSASAASVGQPGNIGAHIVPSYAASKSTHW